MFDTWTLAVLAEMNSRAVSGLDRPSAGSWGVSV
jgi:hypothetical protein